MRAILIVLLAPTAFLLVGALAVFCGLYVGDAIAFGRWP